MMGYTQLRQSLGLTEEEAAQLVAMRAWAKGAIYASSAVVAASKCGSMQEALVTREPSEIPKAVDLLADTDVEEIASA